MQMELTESSVFDGLRAYVAENVLRGEDSGLDGDTPLLEWGVIDSLAMVGLLTFIEESWRIRIPDDEVKPDNFVDLNALTRSVLRLRGSTSEGAGQVNLHEPPIRSLEPYGVTRTLVDVPGGALHALQCKGDGPTWVLLPALGNPASSWGILLRNIAGECNALALDLAGFGLTTSPNPAPTFADQLALVLAGIERLTRGPLVLFGHSAGAMLAATVARKLPGRVHAMVIASFGAIADPAGWWSSLLESSQDPDCFLKRAYYTPPALGPMLRRLLQEALGNPAYHSFLDAPALAAMPGLFEGLRVPTLFVCGEEDRVIPRGAVERAVAAIPGSRIEWLARCGHFPQAERPQELVTLAHVFLASLTPAAVYTRGA
jgi:2-hydroxymuconate-semialdehyde hydrolase